MKLILWQQYVDLLAPNETYNHENLKLKVYNDQSYLNTPRDEQFTYTETDQFQQLLPEPQQVIDTLSITGIVSAWGQGYNQQKSLHILWEENYTLSVFRNLWPMSRL